MRCSASSHALAVIAAESYCNLYHGGYDSNALRVTHNFVGNGLVGCSHNLVENVGGVVDAFLNAGLIFFIVGCPAQAA
jgi:hypothetical protein